MKTVSKKKKTVEEKPKIKFVWNKKEERIGSSTVLIRGSLITCIILSIASGFIDLAFFSGLSKSLLHIGTVPMFAAILYTIISVGFISGKFWCAMKIGMIRELRTRLEANGFNWANRLGKALIPWHLAHKFLIAVSIITALSLSVNSIGSAMKDAERNTTNITVSIDELKALKDQRKSDNTDKRSLTRGNLEGIATSKTTAEAEASRYWPDIEKWQLRVREIDEDLELTDEEKADKKIKERAAYIKRAPTFISSKNIDFISRTELVNKFQEVAKRSEVDNASLEAYAKLANENEEEIKNTIIALENLYKHPDKYEDGIIIKGQTVSFLDEEGNPIDITQAIGMLQGLREEWKTNSDIGESSQIFMLISEAITSKIGQEKTSGSGSGIAEMLMMIFIATAGIVQEFLIAIFTPKAAIDRKLLSQVSQYLLWKDKNEKEKFLISVYTDYVGDGIINQKQYEFKCKKCVEHMEEGVEEIIKKYSAKNKKPREVKPKVENVVNNEEGEYSEKVDNLIKEIEGLI